MPRFTLWTLEEERVCADPKGQTTVNKKALIHCIIREPVWPSGKALGW